MSERCKKCGACKECGASPQPPQFIPYPVYPYAVPSRQPWITPQPWRPTYGTWSITSNVTSGNAGQGMTFNA